MRKKRPPKPAPSPQTCEPFECGLKPKSFLEELSRRTNKKGLPEPSMPLKIKVNSLGHAAGVIVTPAKAGVQKLLENLDSVFRRNDGRQLRSRSNCLI